jgi:anti-anti-sigma factor
MDITGFGIEQSTEPGGEIRLVLRGELDLSGSSCLTEVLEELRRDGVAVRLDLSDVTFMDSTGLGVLLTAVLDARQDSWRLEVSRELTYPVQRLIEIAGAAPYLWPDG